MKILLTLDSSPFLDSAQATCLCHLHLTDSICLAPFSLSFWSHNAHALHHALFLQKPSLVSSYTCICLLKHLHDASSSFFEILPQNPLFMKLLAQPPKSPCSAANWPVNWSATNSKHVTPKQIASLGGIQYHSITIVSSVQAVLFTRWNGLSPSPHMLFRGCSHVYPRTKIGGHGGGEEGSSVALAGLVARAPDSTTI